MVDGDLIRIANRDNEPPSLNWSDKQSFLLRHTRADVLVILDCCQAGSAFRSVYKGRKELLAACGKENDAVAWRLNGKPTFTSKLIDQLKLKSEEAFPVNKLRVDFSKDKELAFTPHHLRFTNADEPIVLSALRQFSEPPIFPSLSYFGTRALISAHITGDPSSFGVDFEQWLSANTSKNVPNVVNLDYVSQATATSTLVMLSMPIEMWSFFPHRAAYSFIGLVDSRNLQLGQQPQKQEGKGTLAILSMPIEVWSFLKSRPGYSFVGLAESQNLLLGQDRPQQFDSVGVLELKGQQKGEFKEEGAGKHLPQ